MKFQLPSFISFIVTAAGMIGRVGLVNFNVTFYLSLVLSSHPPDEPLSQCARSWSKEVWMTNLQNNICVNSYFFTYWHRRAIFSKKCQWYLKVSSVLFKKNTVLWRRKTLNNYYDLWFLVCVSNIHDREILELVFSFPFQLSSTSSVYFEIYQFANLPIVWSDEFQW